MDEPEPEAWREGRTGGRGSGRASSAERRPVRYWRRLPPTVAVALAVLLAETVGRWLLTATVGLGVRPTGAVVALGAVLLGPAAAPGAFLGALLAGLATTGIPPALASAVGVAIGVALGGAAAEAFGPGETGSGRAWAGRYVLVVACAVCVAAAVVALGSDLLGVAPFQLVVERFLARNLPLALAVGPLAWYVTRGSRASGLDLGVGNGSTEPDATGSGSLPDTRWRAAVFGVVSVGWVVAGYALGFVFRATERVPAERIGDRLVPAAARFLELVGPRGIAIQVLLGLVALSVLFVSVGRPGWAYRGWSRIRRGR